ncbi:MAG: hypothetical protein EXS59_02115 [Candidatus Taylorbacteria bacterium]|nr:hypothetical protein [Candidatus Taylorbacteria bacterium]
MTHASTLGVVSIVPVVAFGSDEYVIAQGEMSTATDAEIEAACEAVVRLDKKRMDALAVEKRLRDEAIVAEAKMAETRAKAQEAIEALEVCLQRRKQEAFAVKIGSAAVAVLARIKACLANGNDGGVVAAYYDFKKKSKQAVDLPGELRQPVKSAFARYDGRE